MAKKKRSKKPTSSLALKVQSNVSALIESRDMLATDVARRLVELGYNKNLETAKTQLSQLLNNRRGISSLDAVERLANAFDVDPVSLLK